MPTIGRGAFHLLERAYEIFSRQKDFYGFWMDFFGNKRIFAKSVRDFLGVKCPSQLVSCKTLSLLWFAIEKFDGVTS